MVKRTAAGICFLIFIICVTAQSDRSPARASELVLTDTRSDAPAHSERVDRGACPDNMIEIEGKYCPTVSQICKHWRDNKEGARCEEWSTKVICTSEPVYKHYCIDQYEYPNRKGELPQDWMSWNDMKRVCEAESERLCTRSEWTFAAEGPNRHPYPYGDGFHRDDSICNIDNPLPQIDIQKVKDPKSDEAIILRHFLVRSGDKPQCVSDWGVYDMSGNIDEWVINEGPKVSDKAPPYSSGLMGGHVFGVRNASRPVTDAHAPWFYWYETGGRCCKDAQ